MAMTPEFQAFMEEHFSLDNYAGAADFSLEEWYRQFQRRLLDETRMPKSLNDIDHHFKEILIDPLVSDFESYWFQWNNNLTPVRQWKMTDYFFAKKSVDLAPGKYESFESYKFDAGRLSGLDTAIESFKLAKDKFNNEE